MNKKTWQIKTPLDAVIFDCDSTLSSVEGISVLAQMHNVYKEVDKLTEIAMAKTGINKELYHQRLALVKPLAGEMNTVARAYWDALTPDVDKVIHVLQQLGKTVYVLSAGIKQTVVKFAEKLNIPAANVYAVEIYFDNNGQYKDFDQSSPLATISGKSEIIDQLRKTHQYIAHVGDGMNDIEAAKAVDRFIGYGGACYRESIAELSPFYLRCKSMAPLLALTLTENEALALEGNAKDLYQLGIELISKDQLEIRSI